MIDRVTKYAEEVVAGKYVVGKLHKLACKRHLDDLEKSKNGEIDFYWDVEDSERILEYAETLTTIEGFYKKPVKLLGFQIFDIGARFGWKNKRGFRRFRRSYISMARQNGKSFENGIILSYIAECCGYNFGKLFTVATKKRQAKIAWDEINKFLKADPELDELFDVKEYINLIKSKDTNCTIEALSKEAGLDDGFRSIGSSLDEIHQHKSNAIYKAIYDGTGSLDETLVSMITTRGTEINSFCFEMDTYASNILKGVAFAEDFFVDIYCLDKEDDIWDEKNWIKSNPYLATTETGLEVIKNDARTAKDLGGMDLRDFLTKRLNMWARNTENQYIDIDKWKLCATKKTLEDMRGKKCYAGLDLSSGGDLTTLALEFPLENNKFYLYSHSFMPSPRLEEHIRTDIAPYDIWENKKLITTTGGNTDYKNDYKFIISHLKELIEKYELNLQAIGYDNHNADTFLSDLEEFGVPLLEIKQSAKFLNDGTVDMRLNIKSELIEYDEGNELMTWSFSNAKVVSNSFGEIKVDKEPKAKNKRIDPVDASIDAHITFMKLKEEEPVDLNSVMNEYLEKMGWNTKKNDS